MSVRNLLFRTLLILIAAPLLYLAVSLCCMWSTPRYRPAPDATRTFYLYHDFAHTEIILRAADLGREFTAKIASVAPPPQHGFVAFSYGDARFMANTPTWSDLDPKLALIALFQETEGAIRVGFYDALRDDDSVIPVHIGKRTLQRLRQALMHAFRYRHGHPIPLSLPHPGYIRYFVAKHPYNLFYTCNQWTAQRLREAALPAPVWAPFAFEAVYPYRGR